ncbi:heavy metal translocating P-type ATPase [Halococcus thailandensis]|uniref:Cadmium transporting P-type ATPase n=1 Tax=Halococcus thailandensis JCM 13552 TaxID=1227457 RepID=M0NHG5_9EURY|nr:cation-translocating P-type ATPase [Halococcus thailandensis]EMA56085.1 cadmium transporting P-type ATPase [Halococcus thailandensis JCM 13552]
MNPQQYYRKHRKAIVTATSGFLYGGGWSLGYVTSFDTLSAAILVLATIVGGYDIAKVAVHEIRSRTLGIKTLVTLAAIGAILIGEYWEAAAVVFLFSLGSYLEGRTMRKTRNALQELLEMTPDTALVRRDGDHIEVPAHEVEEGEVVIVRPGEKLPVDGVVVDGESAVNQASVTGESAPVHKRDGDEVYAGTVNQEGALEVETTGAGSDTTLQRIIRRVEEAQEAKAPTESLIDRFATYYTPAIIVLAVGAYVVTQNALLALTLLVIGCPGALVIGPPVSIVSAIGNAARSGVLMKGGEHLERAGKIDLVALDKTGTLTTGETSVTNVRGFDYDSGEALRLAAIAEKKSEHHLAGAVLDAARSPDDGVIADGGAYVDGSEGVADRRASGETAAEQAGIPDPEEFTVAAGKGVIAWYEGHEIVVGNRMLLDERDIAVPEAVEEHVHDREESGETAVYVVLDGDVAGVIALRDRVRDAAPSVVGALDDAGVQTVMLTGDNERTARTVAEYVGIDDYRAELLPEDKQRIISELREEDTVVAMVGDGINDAPSLATADIGIAMGAAGTDTAIETADMALMADDLERIPYAVGLSKATRWNIYENVAIAVLTVTLLLAGVLTNYVHLAAGMLVHEASVLAVILNGMRLLRH